MSPVAVSVYLPSSLMSSRIVGSAGVYFRLALYSHDLAELKVGMRCTTVFEMSSQIVVSELVKFLVYRRNWFHFICAASVDMIHYLFGDDSCMVCWVRVYLSAESNWYGVYSWKETWTTRHCASPKCSVIIFAYLSIDVTIVCNILSTFSVRYEANIELCICHVGWWIRMKSLCSVILFIS